MLMRGKREVMGESIMLVEGVRGEVHSEVEFADYEVAALVMCDDDKVGDCLSMEKDGVRRDDVGVDGMGPFLVIEAHLSKTICGLRGSLKKRGNVVYITA